MSRRPLESARSPSLLAGDRGIWIFAGLVVVVAACATSLATVATQLVQGLPAPKGKTLVVQSLARPAPAPTVPAEASP